MACAAQLLRFHARASLLAARQGVSRARRYVCPQRHAARALDAITADVLSLSVMPCSFTTPALPALAQLSTATSMDSSPDFVKSFLLIFFSRIRRPFFITCSRARPLIGRAAAAGLARASRLGAAGACYTYPPWMAALVRGPSTRHRRAHGATGTPSHAGTPRTARGTPRATRTCDRTRNSSQHASRCSHTRVSQQQCQ